MTVFSRRAGGFHAGRIVLHRILQVFGTFPTVPWVSGGKYAGHGVKTAVLNKVHAGNEGKQSSCNLLCVLCSLICLTFIPCFLFSRRYSLGPCCMAVLAKMVE